MGAALCTAILSLEQGTVRVGWATVINSLDIGSLNA